jgi:uncharacterized protein
MYLLKNLQISVQKDPDLVQHICGKLGISSSQILHYEILLRSIDARHRNHLNYNYTLLIDLAKPIPIHTDLLSYHETLPEQIVPIHITDLNPFIIGTGPAGLFCALALVEQGLKPFLFDRGDALPERSKKVQTFWNTGQLDPESNVQFGEGGAGTFSDGKLTARNRTGYSRKVFELLVQFGANPDIKFEALPHIGTDVLRTVLTNLRIYLEERGCRFFWNHRLEQITIDKDKIREVIINGIKYQPESIVLAIGNAARDTFEMLNDKQVQMMSKAFALGFRIEHSQDFINDSFYGKNADFSLTGPATYRLTAKSGNRGVYSFCMCPGGEVIAAASEQGMQVTNGMSNHARDGQFANSAIVVTVDQADFGTNTLDGLNLQRQIENKAFRRDYTAPVQNASDFLTNKITLGKIRTSYRPDIKSEDISGVFQNDINLALKDGLRTFSKCIPGFCDNGLLIAPETRTSSPVRITRDSLTGASTNVSNLYPIGEGSGYAGGIISSAVDGYKLGLRFVVHSSGCNL